MRREKRRAEIAEKKKRGDVLWEAWEVANLAELKSQTTRREGTCSGRPWRCQISLKSLDPALAAESPTPTACGTGRRWSSRMDGARPVPRGTTQATTVDLKMRRDRRA
ncbi:hypothetical protein U9M48_011800 [Paspalum notatum var. saurae]|uniref:Uncharacterized protein n=1 Tax=Paspalum notatum var. saurae TaxID=547442 RepID=A0AAQ3SW51_PASNO